MNGKLIMKVNEMEDEKAWLSMRNTGIGGTDASAIYGVNKWKSPFQLWLEKTGQVKPEDMSDNQRVYWGKKNEANIAEWFEETTGKKTRRCGMLANEKYPFMLANVDRLIVGEEAGLEIKTAGVQASKEWAEDNMPDAYYVQCQWYMYITGFDKWYIAVLIGGNEAKWKEVARNEELITELEEKVKTFWLENVQGNKMPAVDGSENCGKALAQKFSGIPDTQIELSDKEFTIVEEIKMLNEQKTVLETAIEAYKNELKEFLGDCDTGFYNNEKVCTWKITKGRTTVDTKALKEKYPDVYKEVARAGKPTRMFKI